MSWFKLTLKYSCRWWTHEIQSTVHQIWAAYHQQISVKKICALNQIKKKVIHRVKTAQFYKNMHEAITEKKSIWKLTHWIKKRSYLLSELLIILSLYKQISSIKQCYCFRIISRVISSLDLNQRSSSDSSLENQDQI